MLLAGPAVAMAARRAVMTGLAADRQDITDERPEASHRLFEMTGILVPGRHIGSGKEKCGAVSS